jgi:hypothetical protein
MELKSYDLVDIQDYRGEVYIKSEADNMIALLKDKANYNEYAYKRKSEELADSCRFYEDELRRQKYKRCLAMASYWVAVSYQCVDDKHRQRAKRHHYKWLEIAQKFKEAK